MCKAVGVTLLAVNGSMLAVFAGLLMICGGPTIRSYRPTLSRTGTVGSRPLAVPGTTPGDCPSRVICHGALVGR